MLYMGGAEILPGLVWLVAMTLEEVRRRESSGQIQPEAASSIRTAMSDPDKILNHLPLDDHPQ
jgi:hypothetical protein